jgi:micrococcal nuclease
MNKLSIVLALALSISPFIAAPSYAASTAPAKTQGTVKQQKTTAKVTQVIDGDTLKVTINGKSSTVQLIGVKANQTSYTKKLLQGKTVQLEFDKERYDRYGRLYAYVWLNKEMVNLHLLQKGQATQALLGKNVAYQNAFKQATVKKTVTQLPQPNKVESSLPWEFTLEDGVMLQGSFHLVPSEKIKVTYTVKSGDTLWDIGKRFAVNVETLRELNQLNPEKPLQIGQVLTIHSSMPLLLAVR